MILFSVLFLTRSLSATKVLVPRKTADIELLFWDPPFASFPRWPRPPPPPLGLSSLFREGGRFGKLRVSGTKNPNKKGADGRRQRMQIRPPPPPAAVTAAATAAVCYCCCGPCISTPSPPPAPRNIGGYVFRHWLI